MKKNNIMIGTLVLVAGSVFAKVFSAVYRILLTRILGGEGIGLYQLVFPFYSLCVVFATAGLPMAISKVISKNKGKEFAVFKKSLLFTTLISLTLTFLLIVLSHGLATLQGQGEISICYLILAPTIIIVSVSSALRGYFQGKHNFVPSAVANIVEQFVKMCVGLILSLSLIGLGVLYAVIGAMVGIVVSEVLSLVILLLYMKKTPKSQLGKPKISLKDLVKDIMPITLTNIILPIATFIDSVLVVNLLMFNFTNKISVFLYGLESGVVSSLVSLPTIFSFAIASVILPNLTVLNNKFNQANKVEMAIKSVLMITVPCVVCFTLIPNRLIEVLYQNKLSAYGIDGINVASRLLSLSGFGVVFLALNQVFSSCLQALDERYATIRNLSIAVVVKLVVEVLFLPSRYLNIYALAISNSVCYVTVMALNYVEIKQIFSIKISYMFMCKLVFANCVLVLTIISILSLNHSIGNTILGVAVGAGAYFITLLKTKIFNRQDKAMLKYKV